MEEYTPVSDRIMWELYVEISGVVQLLVLYVLVQGG